MRIRAANLLACLLVLAGSVQAQNAADAFFDPEEMARARAALKAHHGSQINSLLLSERLEYQSNSDQSELVWEGQGWVGSDLRKLWVKTEGEFSTDDNSLEEAELQLLYSRAVSPFWELQAGIRHDIDPSPSRTFAVLGMQGLAPYWFELDASLFLSNQGDLSARIEAEYELRFTQRLILQPRVELNLAFSNDKAVGVGAGLSTAQAGLRLRYEIRRQFAPYLGVSWGDAFGQTADIQRLSGEQQGNEISWLTGVRFWF